MPALSSNILHNVTEQHTHTVMSDHYTEADSTPPSSGKSAAIRMLPPDFLYKSSHTYLSPVEVAERVIYI